MLCPRKLSDFDVGQPCWTVMIKCTCFRNRSDEQLCYTWPRTPHAIQAGDERQAP